jgi:hypothetical protein
MQVYQTHDVIFVEFVFTFFYYRSPFASELLITDYKVSSTSICRISQLLIFGRMHQQTLKTCSAHLRALGTLVEKMQAEIQTVLFNVELALQEEKLKEVKDSQSSYIPRTPPLLLMTALSPPLQHFAARHARSLVPINAGKTSFCFHQSN